MGLPISYSQGSAQHEFVRSTSVYLFAQDSWKIKSNVTLNYGLRWEVNTPLTDIGQKVQTFNAWPELNHLSVSTYCRDNPLFATFGGRAGACDAKGSRQPVWWFPATKACRVASRNTYYKALRRGWA